jgi:hypothetical protein
MPEIKTHYNINNLDSREINFVLNQIANRLDALEGLRGTPRFYADINAGANKIVNAVAGSEDSEVLTFPSTIDDFTNANHDHENTVGGGQLDHGLTLTSVSRADDDHPGYPWLAGRAGGQVQIGGTGAGDDYTIQTTAHATKGSYIFSEMTTAGFLKNTAAGVVTGGNTFDLPVGTIIGWSGFLSDCPAGFAVCDGTSGTPDLTGEFVV